MNEPTTCALCQAPGPLTSVMVCCDCKPKLPRLQTAEARLAGLLDHLGDIEHVYLNERTDFARCPACEHINVPDHQQRTHEPDCWIDAALHPKVTKGTP